MKELYIYAANKIGQMKSAISTIYSRLIFYIQDVNCGKNIIVNGRLILKNEGCLVIGNNVKINSSEKANPIGGNSHTFITVYRNAKLTIGDNARISNTAISCFEEIRIGENVFIGANVKIYDSDFHPITPEYRYGEGRDNSKAMKKSVVINDGAFVGAHSIILKGVHIGRNSVVGAGSVITRNIPDNEIWAGNPAKYIRSL